MKYIKNLTLSLGLLLITIIMAPATFAQAVQNHVRIVGSNRTIWFGDVTNNGCNITDTSNVQHTITEPMAICALDAASKIGNFDYTVKDFGGSLGLFLESIGEDKPASDFSSYWLYDINGAGASVGAASYKTIEGDSLFFHFENPNADLNQRAINDGISYLKSQQQNSGQISGFNGITSWATMTFVATGINPTTVKQEGLSLLDYIKANKPTSSSGATDWERDILAITASGENPFNFDGVNYVQNLENNHNNSQLGSTSQVNDDFFGLLALVSAGNNTSGQIKQDSLNFILSHQLADGGFSWSTTGTSDVDDTAAALQALKAAQSSGMNASGLTEGIQKAKDYLVSAQNNDGGFPYSKGDGSNSSTTAWATMALISVGESGDKIDKAKDYIRGNQEENGSFKWQSGSTGETFTSSYAILALTGKYWPVKVFEGTIPSPTPSASPSPTVTPIPSPSTTPSPSASPSVSPSASPVPTASPSMQPSPSLVPTPLPKPGGLDIEAILKEQRQRIEQIKKQQEEKIATLKKDLEERLKKIFEGINNLF